MFEGSPEDIAKQNRLALDADRVRQLEDFEKTNRYIQLMFHLANKNQRVFHYHPADEEYIRRALEIAPQLKDMLTIEPDK